MEKQKLNVIEETKKVTEKFTEKHLPDFKRPGQPTIWEKEDGRAANARE